MRHRSAASIVCATSLIFALSGCGNSQYASTSQNSRTQAGSIAPKAAPTLPASSIPLDTPQSTNAPELTPTQLAEPVDVFLDHLNGQKGTPWLHVIDAENGITLAEHNANIAHTPASTTKILTALTALHHLDQNATLTTGTALAGHKLYLWGMGDLLLNTEKNSPYAVNGRANLSELASKTAQKLHNMGITHITLHWAPQPFDGPAHLPEWTQQEVQDYEGRVAAYAIDSGIVPSGETFVADPERDVAQEMSALLTSSGITVTTGKAEEKPQDAQPVATITSATIGEQIRYMLAQSDNTVADQYCRLAAKAAQEPTSYTGAIDTVKRTLTELNIPTDGLALDDCSGLSSKNRISPRTLTQALYHAAHSTRAEHKNLIRSLPIAGAQGTMRKRHYDGKAIGNVQAKTGSLSEVTSLAGIVRSSSGREIIFAMGVDNTDEGAAYFMRPYIDEFIQSIADL